MIDGIPKNTGNSYLVKGAALPDSYAAFKAAIEAGTLPIDLNFNSPGWQVPGTLLSKANLLSDATAQAFGLTGNATVNDALSLCGSKLSNTMLYVPLRNMSFKSTTMPNINCSGIAYGLNKFVAVGSLCSNYSTDGITWNSGTGGIGSAVTYGNGKFVATANSFKYSTDGITWNTTSDGIPTGEDWKSIAYGNGKYVAISSRNKIIYSTDGITWNEATHPVVNEGFKSIAWGNNKFVIVCGGFDAYSSKSLYSSDGITWNTTSISSGQWNAVTYGDSGFVAIEILGENHSAVSVDGIHWNTYSIGSSYSVKWQSLAYGNGKYVAVSIDQSTSAAYSYDGKKWNIISLPTAQNWATIAYGINKFVTGGNSTNAAYSEEGAITNLILTDVKGNVLGKVAVTQ